MRKPWASGRRSTASAAADRPGRARCRAALHDEVVDHVIATTSPLRVRPRHCDAQATVHASRYYESFEDALIDWLDEHAGGYLHLCRQDRIDFVVVASGCEYRQPAGLDHV
jgi:hypothetical protein